MKNNIEAMLVLVATAHAGQKDRGGQSYVGHLLRVATTVGYRDVDLTCIALGHDLIEDTFVTPEVLESVGFPDRTIKGIVAMSRRPRQSEQDYRAQVKANRDACVVKMADLEDNMNLNRLPKVTDEDVARTKTYEEFYGELMQFLYE